MILSALHFNSGLGVCIRLKQKIKPLVRYEFLDDASQPLTRSVLMLDSSLLLILCFAGKTGLSIDRSHPDTCLTCLRCLRTQRRVLNWNTSVGGVPVCVLTPITSKTQEYRIFMSTFLNADSHIRFAILQNQ